MKAQALKVKPKLNIAKIPTVGDVLEKTKPQLIMELFNGVNVKNSFYKYASPLLNTTTGSMKINWFYQENFPVAKQDAIIQVLKDYLKTQQ